MNAPAVRPNLFLDRLHRRPSTCQWGLWCSIPTPVTAGLCAGAGFDWLLFDMEHAPADLKYIYAALEASSAYSVTPLVRPPANDPTWIKRLLDAGVQNLLIPFVQNAHEARTAVEAASYPPEGFRSFNLTSQAKGLGQHPGYLTGGARQVGVIVQIETGAALHQLEAIASVKGVSAVFLDPSDLSADLGHIGKPDAPEVRDAIQDAAQRLRKIGKHWGILTGSQEAGHFYAAQGAAFVAVGSDLGLFRVSADSLAASLRESV